MFLVEAYHACKGIKRGKTTLLFRYSPRLSTFIRNVWLTAWCLFILKNHRHPSSCSSIEMYMPSPVEKALHVQKWGRLLLNVRQPLSHSDYRKIIFCIGMARNSLNSTIIFSRGALRRKKKVSVLVILSQSFRRSVFPSNPIGPLAMGMYVYASSAIAQKAPVCWRDAYLL